MYFEPSSNKMIIKKADGTFKELSTEASLQSGAPAGELNYPGGLHSDLTSTYVLDTAPAMHFTSSSPAGTMRGVSYSQGDIVTTWGDCSGNGNHAIVQNISNGPTLSNTGVHDSIYCGTIIGEHYKAIKGHPMLKTIFAVQSGVQYISPFGDYLWGYSSAAVHNTNVNRYFNKDYPSKYEDASLPSIRCALLSADSNHSLSQIPTRVWNSSGGAAYSAPSALIDVSDDSITLLHTYEMNSYELIFFEEALTITQMNIVFNYLKNKYDGLGAISSTLATPLTL